MRTINEEVREMADANRDVDSLLDQIGHAIEQQELDLDLAIVFDELADDRRDVQASKQRRGGHPQPPARGCTFSCGRLLDVFELSQQTLARDEEPLPGIGRGEPPRGALNQPGTEAPFQAG